MYNILKNHITNTAFDLPAVLNRIKSLHGRMEIDDTQRDELEALARKKATPDGSIKTAEKLLELEMRIRALEAKHPAEEAGEEAAYPEYVAGKWYYGGDQCSFKGKHYVCTAPENVTCVWSPEEYPAYWQRVEG